MTAVEAADLKAGNLGVTLSTWIFILFSKGQQPDSAAVAAACVAIRDADADAELDDLGQQLVSAVVELLASAAPDFERVLEAMKALFGDGQVGDDLGQPADRDERARGIRRYQFGRNLPWIARIIDRFPDGQVGAHWVMVEELTDTVKVMDPYPWDEVDEQYVMPLGDFMVKWELAGCESVRFG